HDVGVGSHRGGCLVEAGPGLGGQAQRLGLVGAMDGSNGVCRKAGRPPAQGQRLLPGRVLRVETRPESGPYGVEIHRWEANLSPKRPDRRAQKATSKGELRRRTPKETLTLLGQGTGNFADFSLGRGALPARSP